MSGAASDASILNNRRRIKTNAKLGMKFQKELMQDHRHFGDAVGGRTAMVGFHDHPNLKLSKNQNMLRIYGVT